MISLICVLLLVALSVSGSAFLLGCSSKKKKKPPVAKALPTTMEETIMESVQIQAASKENADAADDFKSAEPLHEAPPPPQKKPTTKATKKKKKEVAPNDPDYQTLNMGNDIFEKKGQAKGQGHAAPKQKGSAGQGQMVAVDDPNYQIMAGLNDNVFKK